MEVDAETSMAGVQTDTIHREEIILEHLTHVQYIARRIHGRLPPCVLLEDLVHAGVLGLLDAMQKYDRQKNVTLKAYAEFRIRGAILDSLRDGDWGPRALRRQARRLEEAISRSQARLGREPTEQEIALVLKMSLQDVHRLRRDLDALQIEDFQELRASQSSAEHGYAEDPFSKTSRSEMTDLLEKAIAELSERERQVLTLYHFRELPMKEVGAALGIGESRVSQIHSAALIRLRAHFMELITPRCGSCGPTLLA